MVAPSNRRVLTSERTERGGDRVMVSQATMQAARHRRSVAAAAGLVAGLPLLAATPATPEASAQGQPPQGTGCARVVDLGTLPGHETSYATDANRVGWVVGSSQPAVGRFPPLWRRFGETGRWRRWTCCQAGPRRKVSTTTAPRPSPSTMRERSQHSGGYMAGTRPSPERSCGTTAIEPGCAELFGTGTPG
jgi:hypothetical protein